MKLITVTSVGLFSKDSIVTACIVNEDVAEQAAAHIKQLADQLAFDTHCVALATYQDCYEYLTGEIEDALRESDALLKEGDDATR